MWNRPDIGASRRTALIPERVFAQYTGADPLVANGETTARRLISSQRERGGYGKPCAKAGVRGALSGCGMYRPHIAELACGADYDR